jgi:hypothetical protein
MGVADTIGTNISLTRDNLKSLNHNHNHNTNHQALLILTKPFLLIKFRDLQSIIRCMGIDKPISNDNKACNKQKLNIG